MALCSSSRDWSTQQQQSVVTAGVVPTCCQGGLLQKTPLLAVAAVVYRTTTVIIKVSQSLRTVYQRCTSDCCGVYLVGYSNLLLPGIPPAGIKYSRVCSSSDTGPARVVIYVP